MTFAMLHFDIETCSGSVLFTVWEQKYLRIGCRTHSLSWNSEIVEQVCVTGFHTSLTVLTFLRQV